MMTPDHVVALVEMRGLAERFSATLEDPKIPGVCRVILGREARLAEDWAEALAYLDWPSEKIIKLRAFAADRAEKLVQARKILELDMHNG